MSPGNDRLLHIPFHPGSPEAALTTADVLDKFARNTKWLFGTGAHDAGSALLALPEAATLAAIVDEIDQRAAGRVMAQA